MAKYSLQEEPPFRRPLALSAFFAWSERKWEMGEWEMGALGLVRHECTRRKTVRRSDVRLLRGVPEGHTS